MVAKCKGRFETLLQFSRSVFVVFVGTSAVLACYILVWNIIKSARAIQVYGSSGWTLEDALRG